MVTGGFTSVENTETTEILESRSSSWTTVGALPYARNGLRAASVANTIYLFVGAETEILKFEANSSSWVHYANMTAKEGSKLEVSPISCSLIQHYLTYTTATEPPTTVFPSTLPPSSLPTSTLPPSTEAPTATTDQAQRGKYACSLIQFLMDNFDLTLLSCYYVTKWVL